MPEGYHTRLDGQDQFTLYSKLVQGKADEGRRECPQQNARNRIMMHAHAADIITRLSRLQIICILLDSGS